MEISFNWDNKSDGRDVVIWYLVKRVLYIFVSSIMFIRNGIIVLVGMMVLGVMFGDSDSDLWLISYVKIDNWIDDVEEREEEVVFG